MRQQALPKSDARNLLILFLGGTIFERYIVFGRSDVITAFADYKLQSETTSKRQGEKNISFK